MYWFIFSTFSIKAKDPTGIPVVHLLLTFSPVILVSFESSGSLLAAALRCRRRLCPFVRAVFPSGGIRLRRNPGRSEGCLVIESATLRSLSKSHCQIFYRLRCSSCFSRTLRWWRSPRRLAGTHFSRLLRAAKRPLCTRFLN